MDNPLEPIASQLISISTALSGLILVFLGGVMASYDAIPAQDRRENIKKKYRRRGFSAFLGFIFSLISLCFSFSFLVFACNWTVWAGGLALIITIFAIVWAAISEIQELM